MLSWTRSTDLQPEHINAVLLTLASAHLLIQEHALDQGLQSTRLVMGCSCTSMFFYIAFLGTPCDGVHLRLHVFYIFFLSTL
jgi:hypothetical protein